MVKQQEEGFTIVELLIAIAMFAIIMPSLIGGLNNLVVINNRSRDLALVNMLAQNKVEMLRSAGFNSVNVGTTDFSSELPSTLASPKSATYAVTNPSDSIKEVTVSISYRDYNKTKSVSYKTIISEIGVGQ